jgi:hypothetical protein
MMSYNISKHVYEDYKNYGILEIHSSTKNNCCVLTDQEYVSHYEPQRDTIIPVSIFIFSILLLQVSNKIKYNNEQINL